MIDACVSPIQAPAPDVLGGWNDAVNVYLGDAKAPPAPSRATTAAARAEAVAAAPSAASAAALASSSSRAAEASAAGKGAENARRPSPHGYRGLAGSAPSATPSALPSAVPVSWPAAGGGGGPTAAARLEALLSRQQKECPRILEELERHRRKVSHWAWWVFPTEMPGASEPPPATAVSAATAGELLQRAPPAWRRCLEEVCNLAESEAFSSGRLSLHTVLPVIDHGRVQHFVR